MNMKLISLALTTVIFGIMSSKFQGLVNNHSITLSQNHPPKVTIITPEKQSTIKSGQQVFYSIQVVDQEDGDSRYAEIVDKEVFIEVRFFPSERVMINAESALPTRDDTVGLQIIKESGCFNCHNSKTALVGPAFYKIAHKYSQQDINKLAISVLEGSAENWASAVMPAQVELSEADAYNAVHWILSKAGDENRNIFAGITGSFPTQPEAITGVYVLKASYTDHGVDGNYESRLTGQHQVILRVN